MDNRNVLFANRIAQAAQVFADRTRCEEGDVPDVKELRKAAEELFQVWLDVDRGLIDEEE